MDASTLQLIILPAGIIAILFALYLARDVLSRDTGTQAMQDVAGTIYEGAVAFIRRQYTTIAIVARIAGLLPTMSITLLSWLTRVLSALFSFCSMRCCSRMRS